MSTRRTFLALSAGAAASAVLPRSGFAERGGDPVFSNASTGAYTQGLLTLERFEKLIGSLFMVFLENSEVGFLRLQAAKKVEIKTAQMPGAGWVLQGRSSIAAVQPETFDLLFSLRGPSFPQDTYLIDHGTLGRFAMFLVPAGAGRYSATFSSFANPVEIPEAPVRRRKQGPVF